MFMELTPSQIVEKLNQYIVGQNDAKKSVAIALRNRYRRKLVDKDLQEEIIPKNILMIGPTGVGKTEIARRLANIAEAPFIKVEVTKFTEVGYVGRDVESMVRDLIESAIRMIKEKKMEEVEKEALRAARERIIENILPMPSQKKKGPFQFLSDEEEKEEEQSESYQRIQRRRDKLMEKLKEGELDDRKIEISIEKDSPQMMELFTGQGVEEMGINFQDMFGDIFPKQKKTRKVKIKEAIDILKDEEAKKLIDNEEVKSEAINLVEDEGIIFLDEIDKVAGKDQASGPDVSREGVQRDILPIVEGSTIMTKHGSVKTDHILFIAAGAFHMSKPSDLIPELQGRFPLRVELKSLSVDDFEQILLQPRNALTKQYRALLETEGMNITFTDDAIREIAEFAYEVNEQTENIGARRLHTIMEKLLEKLSFNAPDNIENNEVTIDVDYVNEQLSEVVKDKDLSKYIL
ncbi:MAG TPA: ATP-dependent protease ATPase subunit HslU [Halanaerobiales bacterium]|nr:ATP-dependent protease ATPase subunit HslU [Halanaerobiales bacterium]